jgi:hypothetical protein
LHCFADPESHQAQLAYLAEVLTCSDSGMVNIVDPSVYSAKVCGGDTDNPTYQQAINGSDSADYLKAMKLEVDTFVGQPTWESVPRTKGMNVLKSTWAFKLKRLPDGTAYRHKDSALVVT